MRANLRCRRRPPGALRWSPWRAPPSRRSESVGGVRVGALLRSAPRALRRRAIELDPIVEARRTRGCCNGHRALLLQWRYYGQHHARCQHRQTRPHRSIRTGGGEIRRAIADGEAKPGEALRPRGPRSRPGRRHEYGAPRAPLAAGRGLLEFRSGRGVPSSGRRSVVQSCSARRSSLSSHVGRVIGLTARRDH